MVEITEFIKGIPSSMVIRQRLAENLRERAVLRRVLKLSLERGPVLSDPSDVDRPEVAK